MPPADPSDHGRGQEQIHIAVTPAESTEELPLAAEDIGTVSAAPATPPNPHPHPDPHVPDSDSPSPHRDRADSP
jgi:hypothetical protein